MEYYPLTIYLDNNIIILLENKSITKEGIEQQIIGDKDQAYSRYFYSLAHIYETDTISGYNGFTKDELVANRLSFIGQLTENLYLHQGTDKKLYAEVRSPIEVYKSITDFPDRGKIFSGFKNDFPYELRDYFRGRLQIDIVKLNNLTPEKVIDYLDEKYKAAGLKESFTETYYQCLQEIQKASEVSKINLYDQIATLFGLLDNAGYYKDKPTAKADFARMWDSNHVYYASYCDIFVSNDRNARKKAEIAYYLLGIPTLVMDAKPNTK
jgi:hypothetical protein